MIDFIQQFSNKIGYQDYYSETIKFFWFALDIF